MTDTRAPAWNPLPRTTSGCSPEIQTRAPPFADAAGTARVSAAPSAARMRGVVMSEAPSEDASENGHRWNLFRPRSPILAAPEDEKGPPRRAALVRMVQRIRALR